MVWAVSIQVILSPLTGFSIVSPTLAILLGYQSIRRSPGQAFPQIEADRGPHERYITRPVSHEPTSTD